MSNYKGKQTLEVLEGADNYNKWIASRIKPFVKTPALEIGAGTGNISEQLKKVKDLTLTDSDPSLVEILANRFANNKNISVEVLDISKNFSKVKNRFASVYLINVLEHIADDKKSLLNINSLLSKSGKIIILVPAKKYAYNKLDKKLGHYRRYEKNELKQKLENANFKVKSIEYFNVVGLLSWMIREKISGNNHELRPYQVKLFDWIVPILRIIEPKKGLPLGISLIAIGEKK